MAITAGLFIVSSVLSLIGLVTFSSVKLVAKTLAVGALCVLIFSLVLGELLGPNGVAWGTVDGYVVMTILQYIALKKSSYGSRTNFDAAPSS
jgi:Na+-driven multidrug efflux pump